MAARGIQRISPNPPGRKWGWKTRHVVECIRELVQIDDTWTYAMSRDLCGVDLQGAEEHLRQSIKDCAMEYGIVLEAVPGVGYQRLSEPGKVAKGHTDLQRVHRKTGRILMEQATVQVGTLSPLEQHRYLVQLAVTRHVAEHTEARRLRELAARPGPPELPPFNVAAHKDLFQRTQASGPDRTRLDTPR